MTRSIRKTTVQAHDQITNYSIVHDLELSCHAGVNYTRDTFSKKKKVEMIQKIHKIFARFILLLRRVEIGDPTKPVKIVIFARFIAG